MSQRAVQCSRGAKLPKEPMESVKRILSEKVFPLGFCRVFSGFPRVFVQGFSRVFLGFPRVFVGFSWVSYGFS